MEDQHKSLVAAFVEAVPPKGPVWEIGSLQVEGQVGFADLRPFFPGLRYVGVDARPGPGVDLVLDAERLLDSGAAGKKSSPRIGTDEHGSGATSRQAPAPAEGIAGTVVCVDMLEHCERPWLAVEQMRRLLAPGGTLLMTSVFSFPIHNHPSDYWRFTPEAFRSLLQSFDAVAVATWGGDDPALAPRAVAGAGFKAPVDPAAVERLRLAMEAWSRSTPKAAFSWKRWLKRWVLPPGWVEAGRGLRGRPAGNRKAVGEVAAER